MEGNVTSLGYNYLGTLDDSVDRFPWLFKITEARLNHSLAVQLITGRPILLNDGYLVQHKLCAKSIIDRDSLLWSLIDSGYVSIMSRGFGRYPLQDMPVAMSESVESMRLLVENRLPDLPPWDEYKHRLADVDARIRTSSKFVPWPSYDAGSGFLVLAKRLIERGASRTSLGLRSLRSDDVLRDFLTEYVDILEADLSAARTKWEQLSERYGNTSKYLGDAATAHLEMMRLANEIYHYNMGIMLSGSLDAPISVETQVSEAFDDLLVVDDIVIDEVPEFPRLNVPNVVTTAPPQKLVQILDPYRPVGKARLRWLELDQKAKLGAKKDSSELRDASVEYARLLSEHLGTSISYKESEGLFSFAMSKALSVPREAVLTGAGAALGAAATQLGVPATAAVLGGSAIGAGAAYLITKLQKNAFGAVTKKVRIRVLNRQFLGSSAYRKLIEKSQSKIRSIMARKIPSSIDLDSRQAKRLLADYRIFSG